MLINRKRIASVVAFFFLRPWINSCSNSSNSYFAIILSFKPQRKRRRSIRFQYIGRTVHSNSLVFHTRETLTGFFEARTRSGLLNKRMFNQERKVMLYEMICKLRSRISPAENNQTAR